MRNGLVLPRLPPGAGGLELAEVVKSAVVGAMEGIAAAFEAGEGLAGVLEGFAEETVGEGFMGAPAVVVVGDFEELGFPKLGFGLAQAAEGPFGIDEDIDEGTLGGGLGAVIVEVLSGERGEGIGVFAADDLGFGVDAGFQGILGRDGLALSGARTGRFGSIQTIGLDLVFSGHK